MIVICRLPDQDDAAAERLLPPIRVFRKEGFEKEENPARIPDQENLTSSPSLLHPEDGGGGGGGVLAEEEEEEVERRQGDGQDIGALAAGARSQKRTRGQKSESAGCAGLQKTDCGHYFQSSKALNSDESSEQDKVIKSDRRPSDGKDGHGFKRIEPSRRGPVEPSWGRVEPSRRGRWTRDSPGSFALSNWNKPP